MVFWVTIPTQNYDGPHLDNYMNKRSCEGSIWHKQIGGSIEKGFNDNDISKVVSFYLYIFTKSYSLSQIMLGVISWVISAFFYNDSLMLCTSYAPFR